MFLGLQMLFFIMVFPIIILIFVIGIINRKRTFGKVILIGFASGITLLGIDIFINLITQKKVLKKEDYYVQYIIDRSYFKGSQADWQYEHFRFEITKNDSIFFYVTEKDRIVKTYKGTITTVKPYSSEVLVIEMEKPIHQILNTNPTIFREPWGFFLFLIH